MKIKILILILFLYVADDIMAASQRLQVIYPPENQNIALVDSTFIFGNLTPGAKLRINEIEIPVHPDGGWLAYIKVSPGPYRFHLVSFFEGDTLWRDWPIYVGPKINPEDKIKPSAFDPSEKAIYRVGSTLEFSFTAPANGNSNFFINRFFPVKMYETGLETPLSPGEAFGKIARDLVAAGLARYIGYYTFVTADTGIRSICYNFTPKRSGKGQPIGDCLDSILTITPAFPPSVGMLVGTSHIVRTGPGSGYKLLYLPPGILVNITGMRDTYYQLDLADNVTGYVNADSVAVLPVGTAVPKGHVSVITVDPASDGILISADLGTKLPYEISENIDGKSLSVDLFGVNGDVDWIRYNVKSPLAEIVTWSQPQDGVFRMNIQADYIWGYNAYYDETKFTLHLREKPKDGSFFRPLKGVKIVVDPGHSSDNGAVGPTGFKEKDANLWISHELRKMLESRGAEVLMTRYGHEHISLYSRPAIAEKWEADLLISVHNNALPDGINPFVNNGTSVYYYFPHSKPLAESIHRRMIKRTGLPDHGLYYGNLVLTRYSSVPSVLVECAFMMLPEQEAMLKTDKFQRQCAKAIVEGISDFLDHVD